MVKDVTGWYTINCQVSENRRLRGERDRHPPSPQQCGETNSSRRFREETSESTYGKDKPASPELVVSAFWQEDT